jgi:microcystin-dependent protein
MYDPNSKYRTIGLYLVMPISAVCISGMIFVARAWAATTVPNTFSSGQVVSSAQMNANFQALVDAVNALNSASVPTATVIAYAGTSIPAGWLLCDGSAVSRTQYAALFAALAISHGGGDGVNTFNIPDYRGRFLRGVDGNAGHDPDALTRTGLQASNTAGPGNTGDQVGSYQSSAFASHTHNVTDPGHVHAPVSAGYFVLDYPTNGTNATLASGSSKGYQDETTTASAQTGITINAAGGSTETRPANVYVQYIIKI